MNVDRVGQVVVLASVCSRGWILHYQLSFLILKLIVVYQKVVFDLLSHMILICRLLAIEIQGPMHTFTALVVVTVLAQIHLALLGLLYFYLAYLVCNLSDVLLDVQLVLNIHLVQKGRIRVTFGFVLRVLNSRFDVLSTVVVH